MISNKQNVDLDLFFLKLSKAKNALLILDYDGTLAPFSENPDDAHPYPEVCDKIKTIMHANHTKVVILSGRDLQGLKILLNIDPPPELWGSHGGERLKENSSNPIIKKLDSTIEDQLKLAAIDAKSKAPGLHCEIKPLSVALHWRDKDAAIAKEQSLFVLEQWKKYVATQLLEIHEFDGGIELRVKGINKGEAVKELLKDTSLETMIAYLGDDLTDEEAFEMLPDNALKVLVRKSIRPTKADIHLIPPSELLWFLDRWIQAQTKEFS